MSIWDATIMRMAELFILLLCLCFVFKTIFLTKLYVLKYIYNKVWEPSRHKEPLWSFFFLSLWSFSPKPFQFSLCAFSTIMSLHLLAVCHSLIHSLFWSLFIQMSNSTDILSSCCFLPLSPVTLFSPIYFLHALHVALILTTGEL